MRPFTFDETRLGYRPRYPEEDKKRNRMRREAFSIVEAAKAAREREERGAAAAR